MSPLEERMKVAHAKGIEIRLTTLQKSIAVLCPGKDFLLLPEELERWKHKIWYWGTEGQACAFIEGLIMGANYARGQLDRGQRELAKPDGTIDMEVLGRKLKEIDQQREEDERAGTLQEAPTQDVEGDSRQRGDSPDA